MPIFRNMELKAQAKYNKNLEETCGLMMEISNIILLDFSHYIEKFVSIHPPAAQRLQNSEVKDEEENFLINIKLVGDIEIFIKSCFDVYLVLVKQVDDMIIPFNMFNKVIQYLARVRMNISRMICTFKNVTTNFKNDEKNVKKYIAYQSEKKVEEEMGSTGRNFRKSYLPKVEKKKSHREFMDLSEKIRRQFIYKVNDENQRIQRLNNVLNKYTMIN